MKYTFYCADPLELKAYEKSFLDNESIPFKVGSTTNSCKIISIDENKITIEVADDEDELDEFKNRILDFYRNL